MRRSVVVVGGGLAGSLVALRLVQTRPEIDVQLLERQSSLGGRHTWCCHASDLPEGSRWIDALVSRRWPAYDVKFPGYQRTLGGGYVALRSPDFHRRVSQVLGARVRTGVEVAAVGERCVRLTSGEEVKGDSIIDARGDQGDAAMVCAYQKFVGLFIKTPRPHGIRRPMLMDATVAQLDGYRFVYVLPWSEHQLLVEDTRYSDSAELDVEALKAAITGYLCTSGLAAWRVEGEETGVLPIPLHGAQAPKVQPGVVGAGVAAGLFHPTTGYSLPEAVRFADWIAATELTGAALATAAQERAAQIWKRGAFCRRLNNMMFMAAAPTARRRIMAQFYNRDQALIERFYNSSLTHLDWLRIMSGRPPVSITAGVKAFFAKAAAG